MEKRVRNLGINKIELDNEDELLYGFSTECDLSLNLIINQTNT